MWALKAILVDAEGTVLARNGAGLSLKMEPFWFQKDATRKESVIENHQKHTVFQWCSERTTTVLARNGRVFLWESTPFYSLPFAEKSPPHFGTIAFTAIIGFEL